MKIENYKGVDIFHNAEKDVFTTSLVLLVSKGKKEYVSAPRLQKMRDEIDKYLNTAVKKPIVKKAWLQKRGYDNYEKVTVILFSLITDSFMVKDEKNKLINVSSDNYRDDNLFVCCKENDAIVSALNRKNAEVKKIQKETSCMAGKLIKLTAQHSK